MDPFESFDPRSLTAPGPIQEWLEPSGCAQLLESNSSLLLVEAGPGFGKTALLAEIHSRVVARGDAAVWVDLSEASLSGAQLVKRILLGFARGPLGGKSTALALALMEPDMSPAVLLQVLLAEIEAYDRACVLMLDGLRVAPESSEDMSALDVIRTLAMRPSAHFRLHVAGRMGVIDNMQQAGVSVDGHRRLAASDLSLDRNQVGVLMRRHIPEAVDVGLSDLIHEQVRGWPAGVMLAVEALRRTRSHHVTDRFLKTWRSALAVCFDCRVLTAMTSAEREYLRHASQFRVFNDGLVGAVMGSADAEVLVSHADLAGKGALLASVELGSSAKGRGRPLALSWYPAFRSYLEDTFRSTLTIEQRQLGQREAVALLQELGLHADAIEGLIELGEVNSAAQLMEDHCEAILERTDVGRIRSWREHLEIARLGPLALVTLAWSELLVSDVAEAERLISAALNRTAGQTASRALSAHLHVLELGLAALSDDLARVIDLIERWQHDFADHDSTWLAHHMSNARSYVAMHAGRQAPAERPSRGAWRKGDEVDLPMVVRHCYQAKTSLLAGRFDAAQEEISRAEELADLLPERMEGARYLPLAVLGLLAWERGDFGTIAERLEPRLPEILGSTLIAHRHDVVTAVARMRGACGDFSGALELLEEAEAGPSRVPKRFALEIDREKLRVHCFQGELGLAADLLETMRSRAESAMQQVADQYQSLARILLSSEGLVAYATGEHEVAYARLIALLAALGPRGAVARYPRMQVMGLMIAILWQLGRHREALSHMEPLLRVARAAGMRQTLLDWREVIHEPLADFAEHYPNSSDSVGKYALTLLGVADASGFEEPVGVEDDELINLLSKREWQVFSLAANGLSTKAIARQLSISPNTVKWHLKNSYEKTGVRNRAQASRLFIAH